MMTTSDVVIIGAGAAGLSAGLVLARAQVSVTLVDAGAPRNAPAEHMHGFISRDGIAPGDFLERGRQEVLSYGASIVSGSVRDVAVLPGDSFRINLGEGAFVSAKALLVATGLTDELPPIPGLAERWGTLVHHCPYCHGYEVRNQRIAVIGGESAEVSIKQAGLLRRQSEHVSLIANGAPLTSADRDRLAARGIEVVDARVLRFIGKPGTLEGVAVDTGATIACDAAFVAPRMRPNDRILEDLGCHRDPATGVMIADAFGQTSAPGVWAAGNVVTPTAQVITAAGAGSASAIAISGWLLGQDLAAPASHT